MRLYYIVSGILILPIVDFAVAAPVLVQQKLRARVNIMDMPEEVMTMLERPKEFPAADPASSSAPPPGPADGKTDVGRPLPSPPEEPSQGSSPDHAPQSPGDWFNGAWVNLVDHPPKEHSEASSSLSQDHATPNPGELDEMWFNLVGDRPEESSQATSSLSLDRAPPGPPNEVTKMWANLLDESHSPPKPEVSSPARPPSDSQLTSYVDEPMDAEQSPLSTTEYPSRVSSPDLAPPNPVEEMWLDLPDHPEGSPPARPSWNFPPSGSAQEWTHFDQWLPSHTEEASLGHSSSSPGSPTGSDYDFMKGNVPHWPGSSESSPASSTMVSAGDGLTGAHTLPSGSVYYLKEEDSTHWPSFPAPSRKISADGGLMGSTDSEATVSE